ncbi:hypothetical protein [Haloarchaeobius litoreus]|uniref:Uncharacterized protein n=1 Tax=Haloarchaeobius litoreus TaxID=755306 RepID=A0ABD6DDR6_9EURY|nr:hypothetical protein [Haloarchaeobius litoreus]
MTDTNAHVSGVSTHADGNPRRWLPLLGVVGFLVGAVQGAEVALSTYPGVLTGALSSQQLGLLLALMNPFLLLAVGYLWATDVAVESEYQHALVAVTASHLLGFGLAVLPRFLFPEQAAYGWPLGIAGFGLVEVLPILATPFVLLGGASVASVRHRVSERSVRESGADSTLSLRWAIGLGVAGLLAGLARWHVTGFGLVFLLDLQTDPALLRLLTATAFPLSFVLNWVLLFGLGSVWGRQHDPASEWRSVFGIVLVAAVFGYVSLYLGQVLVASPDSGYLVDPEGALYLLVQTASCVATPCVVLAGAMVGRFTTDHSR